MPHSQKIVVVTGCSEGGIGSALCKEFAAQGCKVYATHRRTEAMDTLVHPNIERLRMDITDEASVNSAIDDIVTNEGHIDVLVNNAGTMHSGPVIDIHPEVAMQAFNTNVVGVIRTSRAVIPHMASRKSGTIVNISCYLGEFPVPFAGVYSASKAALNSITDTLYMECLPFNISVILVSSGGAQIKVTRNELEHWHNSRTSLYTYYVDAIQDQFDPNRSQMATPLATYSRELVAKVLKTYPPRYISIGYGSRIVAFLNWLPKIFLFRILWYFMEERPQARRAKSR